MTGIVGGSFQNCSLTLETHDPDEVDHLRIYIIMSPPSSTDLNPWTSMPGESSREKSFSSSTRSWTHYRLALDIMEHESPNLDNQLFPKLHQSHPQGWRQFYQTNLTFF